MIKYQAKMSLSSMEKGYHREFFFPQAEVFPRGSSLRTSEARAVIEARGEKKNSKVTSF